MKTIEFDLDSELETALEIEADHDLEQDRETAVESHKRAGKGAKKAPRKALTMSKNTSTGKQLQVMDTMVPGRDLGSGPGHRRRPGSDPDG